MKSADVEAPVVPESQALDPAADESDTDRQHEETLKEWRKIAEATDTADAAEEQSSPAPQDPDRLSPSPTDQQQAAAAPDRNDSPYAIIGQRLALIRNERGMTRNQMADSLGWYAATYSTVENGAATSIDLLCSAAKLLGVSLDWLVGFSDCRTGGIAVRNGRDRLTHPRVNGIRTGYWSPAKKEELIDRLAEYENAEDRGGAS